jgi:hypothetical protein
MIKLCFRSLFSVAFFVIRFFILDAAASPAYTQARMLQSDMAVHPALLTHLQWSATFSYGSPGWCVPFTDPAADI